MSKIAAGAIACALVAMPACCAAQEWTRFRGPNGIGQSEASNLPGQWSEADYNWKRELPGVGNGSPVIWGPSIFLQSGNPESAERYLLAIDAENGQIQWQKSFPAQGYHLHAKSSYGSSTPVVDEEQVYAAWSEPEHTWLRAFGHDGTQNWAIDLGPWLSQHGFGTSPILFEDLVIVVSSQEPNKIDPITPKESFVAAIDRKSGKLRWKTPREVHTASYSVPCIFQPEGQPAQLICSDTVAGMYALNPRTGEPLWNVTAFTMRTVSSPVLVGDIVFGSTGSGAGGNYVSAIQIRPEPKLLYQIKSPAPYVPCVVPHGDLIFLWSDNGVVRCIQAADGAVQWTERVGGNFFGSPVRMGDKICCMSEDGDAVVLAASKEYRLLGRNSLGEGSRATPAIANGRLYLRTYSHLISLGSKTKVAQAR